MAEIKKDALKFEVRRDALPGTAHQGNRSGWRRI